MLAWGVVLKGVSRDTVIITWKMAKIKWKKANILTNCAYFLPKSGWNWIENREKQRRGGNCAASWIVLYWRHGTCGNPQRDLADLRPEERGDPP